MSEQERSERQEFRGDRLADNDLGTKVTSTGGKEKKVPGPHETEGKDAAAGTTTAPQHPADDTSITSGGQRAEE